ncbi:MAG: response regulator [Thermoleophilia bacterium]
MQVLVAHGDTEVRAELASAIVGGSGGELEVIESGEGVEALGLLLQEHAPRLAVVDWDLPGLDGPELCRLVRDFHLGGPPYILLLAGGRDHDLQAGLEAGANECIRTPARAAEIRDRVEASWNFVKVPWERAGRGAALDAVRSYDAEDDAQDALESRRVTLDAVRSCDTDVEPRGSLEGRPVTLDALRFSDNDRLAAGPLGRAAAPAGAPARREAQLAATVS